jgi:hypothetical protein
VPPAWGRYPDTILQFPSAGIDIDLRQPLSPRALLVLAIAGLARPFAVVTACNPLGCSLDDSANRRLSAVLTGLVQDRFPGARPAHGTSPDGAHVEPGWAIPAPLEEARSLATRFLQNAVFWFDGIRFSIVPVHAAGPLLTLPIGPADPAAGR